MTDFVEECRHEWQRLRVPDPLANEMASDLAADLREAEGEGVSAEEVLGNAAFDPRAFAASWAHERGLVEPPRRPRPKSRSLLIGAALATVVLLAAGVGIALFATARHGSGSGPATVGAPASTAARLEVPDVVGRYEEEAVAQLRSVGLSVRIVYRKEAGRTKRAVVGEEPAPGSTVSRGATIVLHIVK